MAALGGSVLVAVALALLDLAARAWRLQLLLWGAGTRTGFKRALRITAVGDAASALTPYRVGGDAARVAMLAQAGVPAGALLTALSCEMAGTWLTAFLVASVLAARFAPDWWSTAAPHLARQAGWAGPWALALAAGMLCATLFFQCRRCGPAKGRTGGAWRTLRRVPWPVGWGVAALSLVHVASRCAVLPVVALALSSPVPLGPCLLGSFVLVFGQPFLPTPSGAGIVDLAALAGTAGDLGPPGPAILAVWRASTAVLTPALGVASLLCAGGPGRLLLGLRKALADRTEPAHRRHTVVARPAEDQPCELPTSQRACLR